MAEVDYRPLTNILMYYTPRVKATVAHNFAKCWPIFKILWHSDSAVNV